MSALATTAVRALGGMERGLYELDLGAPINFTTAARIGGPLTAELVRAALPAVQARHAPLRWRIERGPGGRPWFVSGGAPELALREARGESHVAELEQEINTPFDAAQGPLGRFVLVDCGEGGLWLLATLHHAIGDGMSGAYLMRDLVQACALAAEGRGVALPAIAEAGSLDERLPARTAGVGGWLNHLRFLGREGWLRLRHGRPFKVRPEVPAFAHSRRARVLLRVLDAAATERLSARSRAEGTTVHGALSAAMILEVLGESGGGAGHVSFGSPANVRAQLSPPVGEQLGFYVSMVAFRAAVRASTPFWQLARAVRRQAEADLARGAQLSILRLMPPLASLLGMGTLPPRGLVESWEERVPTTSGLTNLGRLAIETHAGPFGIETCHFVACPSALGDFLATATSLHGHLDWNFIWADPVLSEPRATALADGAVARVQEAIRS